MRLLKTLWPLSLLATLVMSCQIGTPFKGSGYESGKVTLEGAGETVILALTQAVFDRSQRSNFFKQTMSVYDKRDDQPGYVAGSIRTEILGENAYTMTVWKDRKSLHDFVHSRVHLNAMYMGEPSLKQMRSIVKEIPASELPVSWSKAREYLAEKPLTSMKSLSYK